MSKRRGRHAIQLNLLHTRPHLPVWSALPQAVREEVVALLIDLLRQHVSASTAPEESGAPDE